MKSISSRIDCNKFKSPEIFIDNELPDSSVSLNILVQSDEFLSKLRSYSHFKFDKFIGIDSSNLIHYFLSRKQITIECNFNFGESTVTSHSRIIKVGDKNIERNSNEQYYVSSKNGHIDIGTQYSSESNENTLGRDFILQYVYQFQSERLNIGSHPMVHEIKLNSNASNLSAVLNTIRGEQGDVFMDIVKDMNSIFPSVKNISTRPSRSVHGSVEILIWPTIEMRNVELSHSLSACGTGVGQALSILTAAATSKKSVIVVDEINSFLHPASLRQLLHILLKKYNDHQYIISGHNIDMISMAKPERIYLTRKVGFETKISAISSDDSKDILSTSRELGITISDFFGFEKIIWVEGETESICFRELAELSMGVRLPDGILFSAVLSTDAMLRGKRRDLVIEIYRKLSSTSSIVLVETVFSFDRELLSDSVISKIRSKFDRSIYFLPRRNLECFCIFPGSIARLLQERDKDHAHLYSADFVEAGLKSVANSKPLIVDQWKGDLGDRGWLKVVDGARLISSAVSILTENRVNFNKVKDTRFILMDVFHSDRDLISELLDYISGIINRDH